MGNDVGIAENANQGERNAVDSEVLEPNGKEKSNLSLMGGSNLSDGDDIFEEGIDAVSPTNSSKNSSTTKGESIRVVSPLNNNEGNPDVSIDAHKSEGVTGAPGAGLNAEDSVPKTKLLITEENCEDKQISTEQIVKNETQRLMDDGVHESSEGDDSELVNSAATTSETENLSNGKKLLEKSTQEPEYGILNNSSNLGALTFGDAKNVVADSKEVQILQVQDILEPSESVGAVTDLNKLEIERYEVTGIQDVNNVEVADTLSNIPDGVVEHGTPEERIHEVPLEIEDADIVKGSGANPRPESESNGDALHETEQHPVLGSGHQLYGREDTATNLLHSELKEDQVGEQVENSCNSCDTLKDEKNLELKNLDSERMQVVKVDSKDASNEECGGIPSAEALSAADHNRESFGFAANLHPVLDCRTLSMDAEVKANPSQILEESSRSSSQLQLINSNTEVCTSVIERPEQEGVKNDDKEIYLPKIREQEAGSVSGSSSCLDKPSELAPAHPSSLNHAAEKVGRVSQDAVANAEKEIKPAADISNTNSVSPLPVGLRHNVPLPEPASQNRERGPTSAADIPSNNVTSASASRPAGLGRAPLLESTSRVVQVPRVNGAISSVQKQLIEDPTNGESEEYDETREKLQMIRVKFLRLAHRLGQTPHNVVVAQVLYRLGLAEQLHGRSGGRVAAFSFDRASAMAEQLEAAGQEPLDFTCTIMVLGKSGVGKSATINSIFDDVVFGTDASQSGTKKVQDIVGTVQGIKVRVIDTPGLLSSWSDQRQNERILCSVKRFIKKTPPDIVLYLDRLDMQSRDFGDMPLLRTITGIFGPSIWFNAIVVLTHAASAPPEGPNGTATSYDTFVTQRSQAVQQAIRQAAGDMRLMNPVSLVENHSACRTNRAGQRVLPNGQIWKPHLLLLSFASKILAEANTLLKLQDTPPGKPFAPRTRSPPLPFLLSSLLQSRPEVKLPSEQFGDDDDAIDDDLDECSDSEEELEYDELPAFKPLTKAQIEKLTKEQRKAYYDELEYREKLFMKKQLKEERKRRKIMKKLQEESKAVPDYGDNGEEDTSANSSVPVPMPDLVLPASFDSDNPAYRYRSLDSSNSWLVRAVLEPNGWDHDIGYDGINIEKLFVVKDKVPISFSGHVSKDKKDTNLQMEVGSSVKHGNGKITSLGLDMQSVGKDYAYTLRGETRFSNRRINKAAAGLSATILGDVLTGGIKVEDKLIIGKQGQIVVSGGAICGRGEVVYGGSLEATLRDKDHPFGRFLATLGLSIMDWHGDLAIGCNTQAQIPIGRHTNLIGRFNINNRGSGQFSIRINSSEQLQIVLVGLIPLVKKAISYSQQVWYGY